ncbi:hypothetical protein WAI453_005861 [Rhynchosporium graminicola]
MQLISFNYSMPYSEDQRNLAIVLDSDIPEQHYSSCPIGGIYISETQDPTIRKSYHTAISTFVAPYMEEAVSLNKFAPIDPQKPPLSNISNESSPFRATSPFKSASLALRTALCGDSLCDIQFQLTSLTLTQCVNGLARHTQLRNGSLFSYIL